MTINQLQTIEHYISGTRSVQIADGIEAAIAAGDLTAGEHLPTVRAFADSLGVSPTTVSAAFAKLKRRGLLQTSGRRGTAVSLRPPVSVRVGRDLDVPDGVVNLAAGNPDPLLLPGLENALHSIDASPHLYSTEVVHPDLERLARKSFAASGVAADAINVTSGALDGIERILQAHLRPGDRVAVEDPGFTGVLHLLASLGLVVVPVAVDDSGPIPEQVEGALAEGVAAFVLTPRAQNPTGAALDADRVAALQPLFKSHPEVLLIEDDHAGVVAGAPALSLCSDPPERWAIVRSVSKAYGPDLRLAVMASDAVTFSRVEGRQMVGIRWVSFILQRTVVALWRDRDVSKQLRTAAREYTRRRRGLIKALAARGIAAQGRSGLNVWIPVPEEARIVGALLEAGFAVAAGERFRLRTEPGIRVTIASLTPDDAERLADALAAALQPGRRSLSA
jgi:DNA-binding transcriptional MocR family regulator